MSKEKLSFTKSLDQVAGAAFLGKDTVFRPAEVFQILYETKPECIAKILPPPLVPYEKPYVILAHTNFKEVSFDDCLYGPGYLETALYIPCSYNGVKGTFVVAMILNTDIATFMGRERGGYPKKMGTVGYYYKGDRYVAFSARQGIPFVIMEGDLDGEPNDPAFLAELADAVTPDPSQPELTFNYNFKWAPGLGGKLFSTQPMLLQGKKGKFSLGEPKRLGKGKITYIHSDNDPWGDLEVVRVLGCSVDMVESRLFAKGGAAYPVDPDAYAPYAFYGWDHMPRDPKWDNER
ncbi:MAG: acetoacetate decarboxylase family protein [Oscillospiraceae bacterium]|nr:acetoacetate decarboxylase family protein [Oscillospiraceae bacterium]